MPPALKAKQFGLPRWVWLVALTGGVVVGLYIRSRRAEDEYTEDEIALDEEGVAAELAGMEYNGMDSLPVGYYDAVSGASDYYDDVAGEDTTEPIDINGLISALLDQGQGIIGETGPEGARGPRGKKGGVATKPKPKPGKKKPPKGGGGPPKKPKPKTPAKGGGSKKAPKKKKKK